MTDYSRQQLIEEQERHLMTEVARRVKLDIAGWLEEGIPPGAISGALQLCICALMETAGMTEQQIADELQKFVDGLRENPGKAMH